MCDTCYSDVRMQDSDDRLNSSLKLSAGGDPCILCSQEPGGKIAVRPNVDMGGASICDTCVTNSKNADLQYSQAFTPEFEEPNEAIKDVLYIGSKASQVDLEKLKSLGITRVLICCNFLRAYHKSDAGITYHRLPIEDSLVQNLDMYLPDALAFIA